MNSHKEHGRPDSRY